MVASQAETAEVLLGALRNLAIAMEYLREIPSTAASSRVFRPFLAQWDRWVSGSEQVGQEGDVAARAQAAMAALMARLQSLPGDQRRRRAATRILQFARDLQGQIRQRELAIQRQRGALAQRVGNLVGNASRHVGEAIQSAGTLGMLASVSGVMLAVVAVVIGLALLKKG